MSDRSDKSAGISPRRALLEEVLRERSKVVAGLPVDLQDPRPSSVLWPLGAGRLAARGRHDRHAVLELAVLALAWLERHDLDAEPEGVSERAGVGEQEPELGE